MSGGGGVTKAVGNAVGSAAGSLGGAGKVIGPAVQLGTGSSPLGVFGTALGSEVAGSMFGGGSGGGAAGSGGGNRFGMGRNMLNQNVPMGGPFGVNMASPAYNIMMNQQRPQPQPLVQQPVSSYVGGMPTLRQDPQVAELIRQGNMQGARDLVDSLAIKNGKDIAPRPLGSMPAQGVGQNLIDAYNRPQVQQPVGGMPQNDTYFPVGFPQKPGVPGFGLSTAMQPYFRELAQQAVQQPLVSLPRPQVSPPNPGLGLAGLANAIRGIR